MLRLTRSNFARLISPVSRFSSTAAPILNSDNTTNSKDSRIQQIISADIRDQNPVPVFKRALLHKKVAFKDVNGEFSYNDLVVGSKKLSTQISDICGACKNTFSLRFRYYWIFFFSQLTGSGTSSRITYLCPNDVSHVLTLWSTWMGGHIGKSQY